MEAARCPEMLAMQTISYPREPWPDLLPGQRVILKKKAASKGTQEDDIVAYIETDEFGTYYFDFVPDGEYNMIVDIPGLNMIENYDVEIIDNTVVGGLDFVVENDGIYHPGSHGA